MMSSAGSYDKIGKKQGIKGEPSSPQLLPLKRSSLQDGVMQFNVQCVHINRGVTVCTYMYIYTAVIAVSIPQYLIALKYK